MKKRNLVNADRSHENKKNEKRNVVDADRYFETVPWARRSPGLFSLRRMATCAIWPPVRTWLPVASVRAWAARTTRGHAQQCLGAAAFLRNRGIKNRALVSSLTAAWQGLARHGGAITT